MDSWNLSNADAMTVDSWGGGTQLSAFPPLVPVASGNGLFECPTHPQHKTSDPTSFCPLCESNWQTQRQELQAKRQSVEEQLQSLQNVDSAAAILQDLQVSMKQWKPEAEDDPSNSNTNNNGNNNMPRNDFFGRTHPNNNNNNDNYKNNGNRGGGSGGDGPYQTYRPNSRQQQEPPPPSMNGPPSFFSPFPYDQNGGGGGQAPQMQAFAMQLQSMQRMQDWMLWQKEQECQALRSNLEEMRTEVQQLRVDKALLQEKLYQQEERMKHELKLIKLAALQQQKSGGGGAGNNPAFNKKLSGSSAGATSKGSASNPSRDAYSNSNQPVVLLPDHMLSNNNSNNNNGDVSSRVKNVNNNGMGSSSPSRIATHKSAFGTPTPPQAANLSLASYQSSESPQQNQSQQEQAGSDIRRVRSQDESVKSTQSTKSQQSSKSGKSKDSSRNSITKRLAKPAGSWILGRKRNQDKQSSPSASGPVDTDKFVRESDDDDHEPDGIQQHPEIALGPSDVGGIANKNNEFAKGSSGGDGYGTDDSDDEDDDFKQMVANASDLPEMDDIFPPADIPAASPSPPSAGPIPVINVAQPAPTVLRDEISGLTLFTNQEPPPAAAVRSAPNKINQQYKPPTAAPTRGVSFPDSPMRNDDDGSVGNTVASSTFGEDRQKVVDQVILDPYGDKGTYTGIILRSTGMPHGPGRMIYQEDRRTYDGEWRHGRWHGYGRATFANGDTYDGEYRFDQRHGRGRYQWSDGRIYDGMFREDRRHGRGTFTWPDGAVYEGEFRSGQREGQGSYQFSDGGRYEGSWKDGRYSGYGVCKWEDGRCYKGEWLNGMAHGKGIETFADGSVRHDGQWIEDEPML
mmetsp:Transcript_10650/g.20512  ORF Transcript_10650/g.20512 Transcript_10650/m.20512 type:complete len:851 (-) Transcript_10650:179-2731(-)|eukprot:scaffold1771_cov172-Amphora_coffeaeformis.AAC.8